MRCAETMKHIGLEEAKSLGYHINWPMSQPAAAIADTGLSTPPPESWPLTFHSFAGEGRVDCHQIDTALQMLSLGDNPRQVVLVEMWTKGQQRVATTWTRCVLNAQDYWEIAGDGPESSPTPGMYHGTSFDNAQAIKNNAWVVEGYTLAQGGRTASVFVSRVRTRHPQKGLSVEP